MSWLTEIFQRISDAIQLIGTAMSDLVTEIDNVQFTEQTLVSNVLANLRYVVGTPIYMMFILTIQLGIGFMIWACFKAILSIINQLTPRIKGKFNI